MNRKAMKIIWTPREYHQPDVIPKDKAEAQILDNRLIPQAGESLRDFTENSNR
jgi:hypothetical protein